MCVQVNYTSSKDGLDINTDGKLLFICCFIILLSSKTWVTQYAETRPKVGKGVVWLANRVQRQFFFLLATLKICARETERKIL